MSASKAAVVHRCPTHRRMSPALGAFDNGAPMLTLLIDPRRLSFRFALGNGRRGEGAA